MPGKRACLAVGIILTVVQTVGLGALPAAAPVSHPRYAKKLHIEGVSDAGKVNDYLYRGTQPNEKGLKHLRKLGIDTIVDLRGEFHHTMENERRHAAKLGLSLIHISEPTRPY